MYNSPYEEYMRNSLGYNMNPMMNNQIYEDENNFTYNQNGIENMYPEIYKIIYPMVCKACMNMQENITEDLVSRITNEIYINVEGMALEKEDRKVENNVLQNSKNKTEGLENRQGNLEYSRNEKRVTNFLLRDLIRILVLRELIGNQGRPPRPPFRPPFGGTNMWQQRPPFGF